ncbi:MAG: carboxylesterase family protein [Deltaproteobacteria bacterium]|nr:carboxylesterase family protein [Deltaproteobacteria bacterium]
MKNNLWFDLLTPLLIIVSVASVTTSCDSDDDKPGDTGIDTGTLDATTPDAGSTDAITPDVIGTDTGTMEAGATDGSGETPEGSMPDAEPPLEKTEPVTTSLGTVIGEVLIDKRSKSKVHRFRGIPYATAPVGELRWKPPLPVEPWNETLECTEWPNRAPQPEDDIGLGTISEDCLYLNLVTPAERNGLLPVMVFFHGGGLTVHTGNSEVYNNTALPSAGVVVVTVNMRLGAMGYLAHPGLTAESEKSASGNYGTLDMIESLKWVRDHIHSFGGDKDNVTIFGESGGGTKVISVMASPLAAGLFHRAIVESGSSSVLMQTGDLATNEANGVTLQNALGITGNPADPATLAAMRAKTMDEIVATDYTTGLTVDGWVLEDTIPNVFQAGEQINVPLMCGAQTRDIATDLQEGVPALANLMSAIQPNTFVYVFSHLPANWRTQETCAAFHGLELPYVFGSIPEGLSAQIISMFAVPLCAEEPGYDEADDRVAEYGVKLWSQFAKTGNPNYDAMSVTWQAYAAGEGNDHYLEIADPLRVGTDPASAYITAPPAPLPEFTEYKNTEYGFTIEYPETWTDRDMEDGEIWRRSGLVGIPTLRVIVRSVTEGATLQEIFRAQMSATGKSFDDADFILSAGVEINGATYDKALVTYSSATYDYDSVIIGMKINSDTEWIIFEVYTISSRPFDPAELPDAILGTVIWD